jgi:hypothetical protein
MMLVWHEAVEGVSPSPAAPGGRGHGRFLQARRQNGIHTTQEGNVIMLSRIPQMGIAAIVLGVMISMAPSRSFATPLTDRHPSRAPIVDTAEQAAQEPATLILLGTGLIGLARLRRWRRRS